MLCVERERELLYKRSKREREREEEHPQNDSGCSVHYTTNYFRFLFPGTESDAEPIICAGAPPLIASTDLPTS